MVTKRMSEVQDSSLENNLTESSFFLILGIWDHTTHLRICLNRGFVGVPGMGLNFKIPLICIFYSTLGGRW